MMSKKEAEKYLLSICYSVSASLAETWELLVTDSRFSRYFPQLRVEGDKLVFEMEDFCETMGLLIYRPHEAIAYTWDTARVNQQKQGTYILFEEEIPVNFGNECSNAKKDMTAG